MDYLAEKSRILVASGDVKQAMQVTVNAVETSSESNTSALLAVIRCHIAQGDIGDAKAQMDFLKATHENIDKSVLFYYFQALIDKAENKPEESFLSNMRHAIDAHISSLQKIPFGLDYIIQLDACFLIEIATQLLDYAPIAPTKAPDVILKEISRILNIVHENCPGLTKANYLLAKAKFLEMDIDGAEMLLRSCIERNNSLAEVHLLLAQIYLQKQNLEEAAKCLDVGLSFNFKVREHPRYFLIRSKMLKRQKQIDQAIAMLKSALSLPIFSADQQSLKQMDVSESERIAVYLELMDSLQLVGRIHEADSVMQQAVSLYTGKPEEHQLVLMNAQLRLQRGDVDGSLGVLQSVRPDQPNYQAARMKMAQIYLEEKHDRHRFSICYRDILDHDPTPQAYVLLGDAYMSIQEPTKAIEAYETAMRRNPKDHALAEKIGNAYVQCHLYNKAITFYEAAMKSGRQNVMRLRFAEQLFRMGNLEKCERVLREIVDKEGDPMDVQSIKDHVAYWMLLSKLHFENGNWQEATSDLLKAKSLQSKMLTKSALEVPNMQEERKLAANICCQLAELHSNRREWNKATELYKEAVLINDHDIKSMLALASIYMSMGKLQQCNQQCQTILSLDRNNNEATLMMADLMYQRNEGEQAIKHFSQILDRNPNQYHALARCVELSWRKGDMEQVDKYLKNAVENNPRATVDAGYNYCKGLLEW
uniref:Tetratricopeptide repeat protein 21B n=1 Tax=Acrobeloides nanus TaxID=290746 RepID=A0A914CEE5_9BILA